MAKPNVSAKEETGIIEDLLQIVELGETRPKEIRTNRKALALRKAIDRMTADPDEYLLISEICGDIGVSLRTLERAFIEKFGIGPKAYYTRLRLGSVRRRLLEYGKSISIADAANQNGFWHIGQFSNDYRRCFGELPSETVN